MAENMKKNIPENMPPMPDKPKKEKKGEPTADELRDMMKKNGSKGPGGPGGPRAMIREKPKNIKATLGKLLKYIGKNKYSVILIIQFFPASICRRTNGRPPLSSAYNFTMTMIYSHAVITSFLCSVLRFSF